MKKKLAIVTGFGAGLSMSIVNKLLADNYKVIGISRGNKSLKPMSSQNTEFYHINCDVTCSTSLQDALHSIEKEHGLVDVFIHNVAELILQDFMTIELTSFERVWRTICLSAIQVTQSILPAMINNHSGTIIFTGATASVKAGPKSSAFASAKFALRGLAQSLARAYGPHGIHVAHVIIDGVIWGERAEQIFEMDEKDCMNADDIAESYHALINQQPSAWTHELDLRLYNERF